MLEKLMLPDASEALPGRAEPISISGRHTVNGHSIKPPFAEGLATIDLGMGCFWGAERLFWQQEGVYSTAVGYGGGVTQNPAYEEVCAGVTGHTELVRVVYDPKQIDTLSVLRLFWESHNPTQGMRQGNDVGTQYRSAIYVSDEKALELARKSAALYQLKLWQKGWGGITTEIRQDVPFYYAEEYHQQYLHKNPNGYCGLKGCNVSF